MSRVVLFGLLAVVAMAAAVLSFSALRDLGLACGFDPRLAWLVPVVIDAGAAAGSVSWLRGTEPAARVFGRRLALLLLAASVVGNALAHVLEAYRVPAAWGLVVAVSALAPIVLGAVVHLTVLTTQGSSGHSELVGDATANGGTAASTHPVVGQRPTTELEGVGLGDTPEAGAVEHEITRITVKAEDPDRAAELIAEGAGRRRLARELGVSEYEARQVLAARRNGHGGAR